jgi:hypothetical protein
MLPQTPQTDPAQDPTSPMFGAPPAAEQKQAPVFGDAHKKELINIMQRHELEDSASRLADVRNVRKAREFWKGDHYLWWSDTEQRWKSLSASIGMSSQKEMDDVYQYVTNIYQGYGLTFMSVVSQNAPTVRFWPQQPKDPDDQATADAASEIYELVSRNNQMDDKLVDEGFYLWCDGMFGGYVRYVTDGERFGTTKVPTMGQEMRKITPDELQCSCGYSVSAQDAQTPLQVPQPCPNCGTLLTEANLRQGESAPFPIITGSEEKENGEELVDIVGKLELRMPTYVRSLKESPYLLYATEVPKAKLQDLYPDEADDLAQGDMGPTDSEERRSRMNLTSDVHTGGPTNQADTLFTVKRMWLRPWNFNSVTDKTIRAELRELFPDGVHFVAVGNKVLEARSESMDDHWRICFAYPGDGMARPSVGGSLISVQERYNTLANIEVETHEHGIPTLFVDEEAINLAAWQDEGNTPGLTFPVRTRPGLPVQSQMFQTDPAPVSSQLVAHREELMGPVAQFLTGLFPALFGGGAIGNDTAAGYAMQRDQAMGRIGLLWRNMKQFHAEFGRLCVKTFIRNRAGKVEIASLTQLGEVDWKTLHLDQLNGNFFAYPETNEDFPMTWTQKRNTMQSLLNSPLVNVLSTPSNMDAFSRVMGPIGLEFPGVDARTHQFREISDLLASPPNQVPAPVDPATGQPQVDPATGQPAQPALEPTVSVDPDLDDHTTHMQTIQEWSESSAGRRARIENPQGYLNVKMHYKDHQQAAMQQQQQAPAAASGQQGQGGGQPAPGGQQPPAAA